MLTLVMVILLLSTTSCNINTSKVDKIPLNNVEIQLDWDNAGEEYDLDLSAFMLDAEDKVPDNEYVVFYNNTIGPNESVIHSGDKKNDSNKIGEILTLDLDKVDSSINKIAFTVTINNNEDIDLGMIDNAYIKIINKVDDSVISKFDITEYCKKNKSTSLFICEVVNNSGTWLLNPIYEKTDKNLADICHMYGIETE